ncbi:MAG: PaaI family thioesterase [Enhydrobacter sp.]|nr:PaaI family thioesterase [Enhydrobacter sp.]
MSLPPGFHLVANASGFAEANGPWFEKIEDGRLIRGFLPGPRHANSHGIVHGGMLATFIDSAMGSTVSRVLERRCVTVRLSLDYLMPGRIGDWLQAEAEVVGYDENMAQVRARVYGARHDTLTALGSFALLSRLRSGPRKVT